MRVKDYASVLTVLSVMALIASGAIMIYAATNDSGHTGLNPYWLLYIFVPALCAGMHSMVFLKNNTDLKLPGLIALLGGSMGIAFLIYLDKSNALLQYEVWISRGMP